MLHRGVLDRERVPDRCNGLNVRRMAVLWTCRAPSLGRHVCRELLRNALFDFTPIIPATACHQSNYFGTYSRSTCWPPNPLHRLRPLPLHDLLSKICDKTVIRGTDVRSCSAPRGASAQGFGGAVP